MKQLITRLSIITSLLLLSSATIGQTIKLDWVNTFGDIYDDKATDLTIDAQGNIYVTGSFYGTVDFDPDTSTFTLTSGSNSDIYVLKLDTGGDLIWAKSIIGARSQNITVNDSANVYISGIFLDRIDFDPGIGVFNLVGQGWIDAFILKLDSNGEFIWARSLTGSSRVFPQSMAVDISGNLYLTGWFTDSVDFDPGPCEPIINNNLISSLVTNSNKYKRTN